MIKLFVIFLIYVTFVISTLTLVSLALFALMICEIIKAIRNSVRQNKLRREFKKRQKLNKKTAPVIYMTVN